MATVGHGIWGGLFVSLLLLTHSDACPRGILTHAPGGILTHAPGAFCAEMIWSVYKRSQVVGDAFTLITVTCFYKYDLSFHIDGRWQF